MNNDKTYGIWCEVWGGPTGYRVAWLKAAGAIAQFEILAETEAEAKRLTDRMTKNERRSVPSASFRYSAREL